MKKVYDSPKLETVKFTALEIIAANERNGFLDASENDWFIEETHED